MKILVLNSGSSSLKFQLFKMPQQEVLVKGLVERIGEVKGKFKIGNFIIEREFKTHEDALQLLTEYLLNKDNDLISSKDEIEIVGHRVVHGGDKFLSPTVITKDIKKKIEDLFLLAPLHNPANLIGIETAEKIFPKAVQIGIFDTAFHQTIPIENHKYAIPDKFYEMGIRKYGFHGISHQYVSRIAMKKLQKTNSKIITLHLGNGASATAVFDGKSYDTSMGFGPMNGLIMGTRSGDLDQSIIFYLLDKMGYSSYDIQQILNKKSGMTALSGSNDLRDIENRAEKGNVNAILSLRMYANSIKKYIGNFVAKMNGLDALVFTAGIGENSEIVRKLVLENMDYLGIDIEQKKNKNPEEFHNIISSNSSKVQVFVIPTNEELEIAIQSYNIAKNI